MKIDYQKLRKLAEIARDGGTYQEITDYRTMATPQLVLALIEEIEAQNKRIAELEACRAALAAEHGIQIAINELLALAPRLDKRAVDALSVAVEHLCKLIKKEAVSEQN